MRSSFQPGANRDDGAKQATRDLALKLVREHSAFLWSRTHQHLRYDWVELAGNKAPTLSETLLPAHALDGPAKFVGVDHRQTVIDGCREQYKGTPAEWYCGNMKDLVRSKSHPLLQNAGVLVYDSVDGWWAEHNHTLELVCRTALRRHAGIGEFLLVVNVVANVKSRTSYDKQAAAHAGRLEKWTGIKPDIHIYTSNVKPMFWTALRFGF